MKKEVINVENCEETLLLQCNVNLTALIGYQSAVFSKRDQIKDAPNTVVLKIIDLWNPMVNEDLILFFKWNRSLKKVELSKMGVKDYLKIIEALCPYLDNIPKITLDVAIKDDNAITLRKEILGGSASKVEIKYRTHINEDEISRQYCSLSEYIVMNEF